MFIWNVALESEKCPLLGIGHSPRMANGKYGCILAISLFSVYASMSLCLLYLIYMCPSTTIRCVHCNRFIPTTHTHTHKPEHSKLFERISLQWFYIDTAVMQLVSVVWVWLKPRGLHCVNVWEDKTLGSVHHLIFFSPFTTNTHRVQDSDSSNAEIEKSADEKECICSSSMNTCIAYIASEHKTMETRPAEMD